MPYKIYTDVDGKGYEFLTYDLKTAIGHAKNIFSGSLCVKNGEIKSMDLTVLVKDRYDFHIHDLKAIAQDSPLVWWGNNAAVISQHFQAITPYYWSALIRDVR